MTFAGLNYGVSAWGEDTGAADMPVNVGKLRSFIVTHDITYAGADDNPGKPSENYGRHCLIYDLFLTSEKPEKGKITAQSITDEVIIMMNYNAGYTDYETCSPGGKLGFVLV